MLLSEFDFPFDSSLIADRPVDPRDQARLLAVNRAGGTLLHRRVYDLPHLLNPGDLVVVNDTKVRAARIIGHKGSTGGKMDILFVKDLGDSTWEVFLKGKVRQGQTIDLGCETEAKVLGRSGTRTILQVGGPFSVSELMEKVGGMPLPPYIKRRPCEEDKRWYQTIFAKQEGAIAAPTAGLHMTEGLLEAFKKRHIRVANLTLHVGPGTFQPVKTDRVQEHRMEPEPFHITEETAEAVRRTKKDGRRVVAIGTTVVRSLESASDPQVIVKSMKGNTDLFILPGYHFKVVDALVTNFHLPGTTLLMLVSAFAGLERLREAYGEAVRERYRLYSYGDAMLIH